jgi:chromosome segregation ATPase
VCSCWSFDGRSVAVCAASQGSYEENRQKTESKKQKLAQLTEESSRTDEKVATMRERIDTIKSTLSQRDTLRRSIEDNMQLRRRKAECAELERKIVDLEATLEVDSATIQTLESEADRNEAQLTTIRTKVRDGSGSLCFGWC